MIAGEGERALAEVATHAGSPAGREVALDVLGEVVCVDVHAGLRLRVEGLPVDGITVGPLADAMLARPHLSELGAGLRGDIVEVAPVLTLRVPLSTPAEDVVRAASVLVQLGERSPPRGPFR